MGMTRRGFIATNLSIAGLVACEVFPKEVRKTSLIDIVNSFMWRINHSNTRSAQSYLEDHAKQMAHPMMDYLLALVYGANHRLQDSANKFEDVIKAYEKDHMVLEQIQMFTPASLHRHEMYRQGKSQLRMAVLFSPKELLAIYGFWCLFDGSYEKAASAFKAGKKYYTTDEEKKRIKTFAQRINECIQHAGKQKMVYWDEMQKMRAVKNVLDPSYDSMTSNPEQPEHE